MFAGQFGRYRYKQLPFGATLGEDMFQRKLTKFLKNSPMYLVSLMTY